MKIDVLIKKPRILIGYCEIPGEDGWPIGKYFQVVLRSKNGSYTDLHYRYGILYNTVTEKKEPYIIVHGCRDARFLPEFHFTPGLNMVCTKLALKEMEILPDGPKPLQQGSQSDKSEISSSV